MEKNAHGRFAINSVFSFDHILYMIYVYFGGLPVCIQ